MMLRPVDEGLWDLPVPHRFYGLHLGTRMTVARLPDGALWLHSPVPIGDDVAAALAALGPVRHIVCPNLFHHAYAGAAAARYPDATVYGPAGLSRKRPDLVVHQALGEAAPAAWGGALTPLTLAGSMMRETVFLHARTGTIISADLTENFAGSPHWPTSLYLRAAGLHGRVGWSRLLRLAFTDRRAARASVDRLLQWDFHRIVVAHGDIVERGARAALQQTYAFLG